MVYNLPRALRVSFVIALWILTLASQLEFGFAVTAGDKCDSDVDVYACDGRNFLICSNDEWVLQNICASDCLGIPSFAANCARNTIPKSTKSSSRSTTTTSASSSSTSLVTETASTSSTVTVRNPAKAKYIYGPILGALGLILIIFGALFIYRYYRLHRLEKKLVIVEGPGGMRIIVDPDYNPNAALVASDFEPRGTKSIGVKTQKVPTPVSPTSLTTPTKRKPTQGNRRKSISRKETISKFNGTVAIPGFAGCSSTATSPHLARTATINTIGSTFSKIGRSTTVSSSRSSGDGIPQPRGVNTAAAYSEDDSDDSDENVANLASVLEQEFVVVYEYVPKENDEITLNIGDLVKIDLLFNDGWAQGYNITTERSGLLPCSCIVIHTPSKTAEDTSEEIKKPAVNSRRYSDHGLFNYVPSKSRNISDDIPSATASINSESTINGEDINETASGVSITRKKSASKKKKDGAPSINSTTSSATLGRKKSTRSTKSSSPRSPTAGGAVENNPDVEALSSPALSTTP